MKYGVREYAVNIELSSIDLSYESIQDKLSRRN